MISGDTTKWIGQHLKLWKLFWIQQCILIREEENKCLHTKCWAWHYFSSDQKLPYFQISGIFWVSSECFIRSTNYIIKLLNEKCPDVIKWPRKEDYKKIADSFNESWRRQFLNEIGAIHGCHIRISPKKSEIQSYRNFKQFHSIHLQAVCLADRKFTDIFVG